MTDQNYKLVPVEPTEEMIEAAKDRALDFIRCLEVDGADWVDIVKVAIAAAPDLKIRAKPLEWQKEKGAGHNHWSEPHMGLWISFDPEEKPSHRYTAAWVACEPEGFNTLEAAKKYCQDMADSFVRQCAHVGPSAAPEPVCRWRFLSCGLTIECTGGATSRAEAEMRRHDTRCFACGKKVQVVGDE